MGLTILLTVSIYILMICEVYIFLWFLTRGIGLLKGKTDFTVSMMIAVFYLIYALVSGYIIVFNSNNPNGPVSLTDKINQYIVMVVLVNITTPLFPLLAFLRSIVVKRQQSLVKADGDIDKQEKSDS